MKIFTYNNTLDPKIWNDDNTLKPKIRDLLLKIANDFYVNTNLKSEIQDILFLGSSANYNYNPSSDIDVHVVIDISTEKINPEYTRKFMDDLCFKWNTQHDNIKIKGHPVEMYLQDISEPNSNINTARKGSSIYSLFEDKWILKPNKKHIDLDSEKIRKKFEQFKHKIEDFINTKNIDKLKSLMVSIRDYRNSGLTKGGEFSVENLVFKVLRKSGYLKKLKTSINKLYDKKMSFSEQQKNIITYKKTQPLNERLTDNQVVLGNIDGYEINNVKVGLKNHSGTGLSWRYKYPYKTVFWWNQPDDEQKKIVELYLKNKYNVTDIQNHIVGLSNINKTDRFALHSPLLKLSQS